MKSFLKKILRLPKPLILRIARFYGIRTEKPSFNTHVRCKHHGEHPIVASQDVNLPDTTYCNTRSGAITIKANVRFGEYVMLLTGKHMNIEESVAQGEAFGFVPKEGRAIVIEEGCYLGSGAIVVGPAVLGEYSVICAGSVVTKDVPAYTVVGGMPAKVIRNLNKNSDSIKSA